MTRLEELKSRLARAEKELAESGLREKMAAAEEAVKQTDAEAKSAHKTWVDVRAAASERLGFSVGGKWNPELVKALAQESGITEEESKNAERILNPRKKYSHGYDLIADTCNALQNRALSVDPEVAAASKRANDLSSARSEAEIRAWRIRQEIQDREGAINELKDAIAIAEFRRTERTDPDPEEVKRRAEARASEKKKKEQRDRVRKGSEILGEIAKGSRPFVWPPQNDDR